MRKQLEIHEKNVKYIIPPLSRALKKILLQKKLITTHLFLHAKKTFGTTRK